MSDNAALEVWKVTIDVQKHFNDLGLRVRSLAVTLLAALLAAAGYALKDHETVTIFNRERSLAGVILLAGLLCWLACYVMDRMWYHRLLVAAVEHGKKVELALADTIPAIDLTTTIDRGSPIMGLRARHRLSAFYGIIASILWVAAGVSLQFGRAYYLGGIALFAVVALVRFWPRRNKDGEA